MIHLVYLGKLATLLGVAAEDYEWEGEAAELLSALKARSSQWQSVLDENIFRLAVNHVIVQPTHVIAAGDEVALLPPVTGG